MAMRDTKSGPSEEGSYQAPTASMFPGEMPSFQAGASKIFKAFFPLGGNSNFSRQFSFKVKFCFIDSIKEGTEKGKGKVIPLASNDNFEEAKSFKRLHYINTSDIHKLQVHLNQLMPALRIAEALTFDRAKITTFLKMIDKIFATHNIIKDQKRKQWVLNYSLPSIA